MSPTAQPDARTSGTVNIVLAPQADDSSSSGPSGAAGSEQISVNGNGNKPLPNILVISIAYPNWHIKDGKNEDGTQKYKSWKLTSVQHDLSIQLARHNWTPTAPCQILRGSGRTDTKNGTQMFFICADWDHGYKDSENTRIRGASRSDILHTLAEVVGLGGSLVVYYSGHCGRRGRGSSTLALQAGRLVYEEDGAIAQGPPYLISSDCQRIYGEDIYAALRRGLELNGRRRMNIMLIFDTCYVAKFFDHIFKFPTVYSAKPTDGLETYASGESILYQSQLTFIAATTFDQAAGTFMQEDTGKQNGAVTRVMKEFLEDAGVPKTVEGLIKRLNKVCGKYQAPQILALLPKPDLKLLLA